MLTYKAATTKYDKEKWQEAKNEEQKSLEENNTWEVIDIKNIKEGKPLSGKWIFKIKDDGRYKARFVIRGCEQEYGVNCQETYSPVISISALRNLFALAAIKKLIIVIFKIKTAFFFENIDEEVDMHPPEGYDCKGKMFKLKKALYGLRQASLKWNIHFTDFLKEKNFEPVECEQCIFKKSNMTKVKYYKLLTILTLIHQQFI